MKNNSLKGMMLLVSFFISMTSTAQEFYLDIVGDKYGGKDKWCFRIISETEVEVERIIKRNGLSFHDISNAYIPESVEYQGKRYTVTAIGNLAFSECKLLNYVSIPNTVKSIGSSAFSECCFKSIKIPNSVTSIGTHAFYENPWLEDIELPNSITSLSRGILGKCSNLKRITIPNGVTSIGEAAFSKCAKLEYITIPNSVTSIDEMAFWECISLKEITIPNSVKSIGKIAFFGCSSLEEITFPISITSIGERAFQGCSNLRSIKGLHAGIAVDDKAFRDSTYGHNTTPFDLEQYKKTFEFVGNGYVITKLKEWQKKRDFETMAQYRTRVTKENQQKKIQELTKEAIKNYTTKYKLNVTLGDYDADYQMYALNSNYGQKYVKVPLAQAPSFKINFQRAAFNATYVPTEEGLKVDNLTVALNGRRYVAEKTAVEVATNNIDIELPEIVLASNNAPKVAKANPTVVIDRTIDQNIPANAMSNRNTFAVIIGNERYTQVAQVPYANNDARIFAEYCKKTLGLPVQNVRLYENTTFGTMLSAMADVKKIAEAYNGDINVIFYYAGHGVPNESTKDAFLLPVDADGQQTEVCYPVSRLYKELGALGAKNVVVFMDACFSGAQRGEGMLATARGVALKAKAEAPQGNMVVFSAATGDETAYPYKEKGHGMFTYFLLKKLQESKGDCTLQELGEYIQTNVRQQSVVINRKSQTPTVVPSAGIGESWKTMKLK